ncbi:MAG: hypothetical protein EP335_11800 [Alphaproteobacteria bacterium]|nr:MAG: hypothetical protein EP335_11800 [Alphaproteobacteria bacterium]
MNTLKTVTVPDPDDKGFDFLALFVDDERLDTIVAKLVPDVQIEGMSPMPSTCLDEAEMIRLCETWLPAPGITATAPILLCPECGDLFCNVIVAEVRADADTVYWDRIRFEASVYQEIRKGVQEARKEWLADRTVIWLEKIPAMQFERKAYEAVIAALQADRTNMIITG